MSAESAQEEIEVDPGRAAEWMSRSPAPQVLDVREAYEREAGRLEPSIHAELPELAAVAAGLDRDLPVLCYCRVGGRSLVAAQALRAAGFDAYSMRGGLLLWTQEGRPLVPEGGTVADH